MKQYAIYLNSIERFILILDDLWISVQTAKLLSSKMSICVCDISNFQQIENTDSLSWCLNDSSESKQNQQHPSLSIINNGIFNKGLPLDISLDLLKVQKQFVEYVADVCRSAMLVDALLNNVNQKFYLDLLGDSNFEVVDDDSGINGGFLKTVNTILYLSKTVTEIETKLNLILNDPKSNRPSNLKLYRELFYSYMTNE